MRVKQPGTGCHIRLGIIDLFPGPTPPGLHFQDVLRCCRQAGIPVLGVGEGDGNPEVFRQKGDAEIDVVHQHERRHRPADVLHLIGNFHPAVLMQRNAPGQLHGLPFRVAFHRYPLHRDPVRQNRRLHPGGRGIGNAAMEPEASSVFPAGSACLDQAAGGHHPGEEMGGKILLPCFAESPGGDFRPIIGIADARVPVTELVKVQCPLGNHRDLKRPALQAQRLDLLSGYGVREPMPYAIHHFLTTT